MICLSNIFLLHKTSPSLKSRRDQDSKGLSLGRNFGSVFRTAGDALFFIAKQCQPTPKSGLL